MAFEKTKPLYHSELSAQGETTITLRGRVGAGKFGPFVKVIDWNGVERFFNIENDAIAAKLEKLPQGQSIKVKAGGRKEDATLEILTIPPVRYPSQQSDEPVRPIYNDLDDALSLAIEVAGNHGFNDAAIISELTRSALIAISHSGGTRPLKDSVSRTMTAGVDISFLDRPSGYRDDPQAPWRRLGLEKPEVVEVAIASNDKLSEEERSQLRDYLESLKAPLF